MGKNSLIKSTSKGNKSEEKKKAKKETEEITPEKSMAESQQPSSPKPSSVKKTDKKEVKSTPKKTAEAPPEKKTDTPKKSPPPDPEPPKPPEPPVTVTYDSPTGAGAGAPMDKTLMVLAGCILFLFLLIIGASTSNCSRYYIKALPMGIEIERGKFAPLGKEKLIVLSDINAPETQKAVYRRDEVYPLIFRHYLNKADALLAAPGLPDYEEIKRHLSKAENYAVTNELAQAASRRLTAIDLNNLQYRAGVAQENDTIPELEKALDYLTQAGQLDLLPEQMERISLQRDVIRERVRELKDIKAALVATPAEEPASK